MPTFVIYVSEPLKCFIILEREEDVPGQGGSSRILQGGAAIILLEFYQAGLPICVFGDCLSIPCLESLSIQGPVCV